MPGPNLSPPIPPSSCAAGPRAGHTPTHRRLTSLGDPLTSAPAVPRRTPCRQSHGTMVAGLLAARTNNSIGVAGLAHQVGKWVPAASACPLAAVHGSLVCKKDRQTAPWARNEGAGWVRCALPSGIPAGPPTLPTCPWALHGLLPAGAGHPALACRQLVLWVELQPPPHPPARPLSAGTSPDVPRLQCHHRRFLHFYQQVHRSVPPGRWFTSSPSSR